MLYYSSKSLKIFEKMPDLPKNRKANMNYRKKNIIVLDNGTANYLKNEIKIEGGNAKKQLEKNRSYMIKNDKD